MATVLAVDDSASLRGAIVFALTERGGNYGVIEAEEGKQALGLIEQRRSAGKSAFDLILVDINMPGMSGYEVVEEIRAMPDYRFTPILFLTTESSDQSKLRGKELQATGWVTKPFSPENLLNIVNRVLH